MPAPILTTRYQYLLRVLQIAKSWVEQLSAVGKPIDNEDLISFIINGLNLAYTSLWPQTPLLQYPTLTSLDFEAGLLSYEILITSKQQSADGFLLPKIWNPNQKEVQSTKKQLIYTNQAKFFIQVRKFSLIL